MCSANPESIQKMMWGNLKQSECLGNLCIDSIHPGLSFQREKKYVWILCRPVGISFVYIAKILVKWSYIREKYCLIQLFSELHQGVQLACRGTWSKYSRTICSSQLSMENLQFVVLKNCIWNHLIRRCHLILDATKKLSKTQFFTRNKI